MRALNNDELFAVSGGGFDWVCRVEDFDDAFAAYDRGDFTSGYDFGPFSESPYSRQMDYDSGAVESMNFFTPKGFVIGFIVEGVKELTKRIGGN